MDLRQCRKYGAFLRRQGWKVERVKTKKGNFVQVAIKKIPMLPISIMKCQRFAHEPEGRCLNQLKRKHGVIYSIWEPANDKAEDYCIREKMERKESGYLPGASVVVDLRRSKKEIWLGVSKDTRRVIRKASRVEVEQITGAKKRWLAWKSWQQFGRGYVPRYQAFENMAKSFGKDMVVLVGRNRGKIVAGEVLLICEKKAYYYYAWTSQSGRRIGAQAKLVWEGMMRMKERGVKSWDFEGIDDSRNPRKSWVGFSRFKMNFGGERVIYPLSYRQWF